MIVATYNIHRGIGGDRRRRPERVAAVIREIEADVLALQEVDWRPGSAGGETQFDYFAAETGLTAIPGPNIRDHRGHYGNVLLSRLPVLEVDRIAFAPGRFEPRGAIDATLRLGEGTIRVIATHLGLRPRERRAQARKLREMLEARADEPAVILGDLNDWWPGTPSLRPLLAACDPSVQPRSYPTRLALLRLDWILTYGFGTKLKPRVHDGPLARQASDHLPVVASIDAPTESPSEDMPATLIPHA